MSKVTAPSIHDHIKYRIEDECRKLGFTARSEYSGKDWRADVFATNGKLTYAFEVQISPQSLKRTIQRQDKYIRDGVIGCWLFEKTPSKLWDERPDLPLFTIINGVRVNIQ